MHKTLEYGIIVVSISKEDLTMWTILVILLIVTFQISFLGLIIITISRAIKYTKLKKVYPNIDKHDFSIKEQKC